MSLSEQSTDRLNRRPSAENRRGLLRPERWLERWTDLFSVQRGRALVLGGSLGLETSLLLGLGFQVTAVDFSAALLEPSVQRNPLAEHHVVDVRGLGAPLTGRFSIIAANLSLRSFEPILVEQAFTTAAGFLSPLGLFALRVDGSRTARSAVLSTPEAAQPPVRPSDLSTDEKWISALVMQELEHVSVERWSANGLAGQDYVLEVVGAKSAEDSPDAWPIPRTAVQRRAVTLIPGR